MIKDATLSNLKEPSRLQAMVLFLEGIDEFNYYDVIHEKVRPYELDGWQACLEGGFSWFKSKEQGRYQVTFMRRVEEDK